MWGIDRIAVCPTIFIGRENQRYKLARSVGSLANVGLIERSARLRHPWLLTNGLT
jgi:hypothetical protein